MELITLFPHTLSMMDNISAQDKQCLRRTAVPLKPPDFLSLTLKSNVKKGQKSENILSQSRRSRRI